MKTITLRNLPPEIADYIEAEATKTNASLNATVIRLLQKAASLDAPNQKPSSKEYHDLDFLCGSWSKEEADEFDRYLEESRRIDMELTKLEWQKEDSDK